MYPEQPAYPGQPNPGQEQYPGQQQYPPNQGYPAQQGYPQQPVSGQPAYPPQPVSGNPGYQQQPYGPPTTAQPPATGQPSYPGTDPTSWGNQPVSTGPMGGVGPVSPAYTGQFGAGGYPPTPAGPPKKSRKTLVMSLVNAVLLLALLGVGGYVLTTTGGLRDDVATLKEQKAANEKVKTDAEAQLKADFEKADLRGKLQKVRDLTTASSKALTDWAANKEAVPIKTVQDAINKCNAAIFDYDATAAKFPASMLGDLPARIATTASTTNCSRLNP